MERDQLSELQFITLIANLPSILDRGILSHVLAEEIEHTSVAAAEIQDIRAGKTVPGGRALHEHANLYFHARNPMMAKRQERHAELCVLRVGVDVLDLPDVVISSQNASSKYAAFRPSPEGLAIVNYELAFARDWRDPDQIAYWRKKSMKCAEVLVPDLVPPDHITGVYCSGEVGRDAVQAICDLTVTVDPDLFLQVDD
jgi:ssDNA thymidine ADP-ribosyltransferase DarT-like protein